MNAKIKEMQAEIENSNLLPYFEIEIKDLRTNKDAYLLCDVFIHKHSLVAQYEALNDKQSKSKKIAHTKIAIDTFFSLDTNLQELYSAIIQDIISDSTYFTLRD